MKAVMLSCQYIAHLLRDNQMVCGSLSLKKLSVTV